MKMENTITAPYAGTVSSVLVGVNTQVDAGAPLVRLQAPDHAEPDPVSAPIDLAALAGTPAPSEPEEDAGEEHARSSQEYMLTYLSFLGTGAQRGSRSFPEATAGRPGTLRRPHPQAHPGTRASAVARLLLGQPDARRGTHRDRDLDSPRRAGDGPGPGHDRRQAGLLDRLIQTTQGRQQEVCDLAREVRFQYVDAPLLKASRAHAYAGIAACVSELSGRPSPERRRELTDRLIWFPLPMRALLRDSYRAADTATRARLLKV